MPIREISGFQCFAFPHFQLLNFNPQLWHRKKKREAREFTLERRGERITRGSEPIRINPGTLKNPGSHGTLQANYFRMGGVLQGIRVFKGPHVFPIGICIEEKLDRQKKNKKYFKRERGYTGGMKDLAVWAQDILKTGKI